MSDVPPTARTPGGVPAGPAEPGFAASSGPATYPPQGGQTTAEQGRQVAQAGRQAAAGAAADVKDTAAEQAQRVAGEVRTQARSVAADVRDRLGEQARGQSRRLAGGMRQMADQLDEMRGDRTDSPAATVVARVADSGRQLADYLERNGPEGVLREVQDFGRRRPGAFLAAALATGFLVGRLGKTVVQAQPAEDQAKPSSDAFVSRTGTSGYPGPTATTPSTSTEYAATGTGMPIAVDETLERPGDLR